MSKELKVLSAFESDYKLALEEWGEYLSEADTDTKFFLGDQWSSKDKRYLAKENREAYVFNEISRVVKQISGHQRRNRLQSISVPTQTQDQLTSDIITDCLGTIMRKRNGYNVLSDAFEQGALVSAINLVSIWMDYSKDPVNGDICIDRIPYNSFLIDPSTTKIDLSDCGFITRRIYVSKEAAKALVPSKAKMIEDINPCGNDDKYSYMSNNRRTNAQNKLLAYDEYWKRGSKKAYIVTHRTTGESTIYRGSKAELNRYIKEYPFYEVKAFFEKTMELNIIIEGQLVFSDKDPNGLNDFPFVPVVGYFSPEYYDYKYRLQGIVRKLRDPQEELNKMRSKASDIIKSQVNSGWEIEQGQVENVEDLYKTGQGVVIERVPGTAPLKRIQAPELSNAFPAMILDLQKNVVELPGGSQELFGVAEGGNGQISGTLAKARAGNALTAFNSLFDNLSLSQKLLSEKIVKMVLMNYKPEKIEQMTDQKLPRQTVVDEMTGQQREEIIPFDVEEILKYDIQCSEGLETESQRETAFLQALEAKNMGVPVPDSFLIKMLPISNKTELQEAYEQEAQQMQAKTDKQESIIQRQEELNIKLNNAKIVSDLSLADERRTRGLANAGLLIERTSESIQNQSSAVLDQVKAAAEIADIKQESLMKALTFIQQMGNNAQKEGVENQIITKQVNQSASPEQQFVALNQEAMNVNQPQEQAENAPMM